MRALAAAALIALTPAAARAADEGDRPRRLAGEALASATASVLHGVGESGYGLRFGLGAERDTRTPRGGPGVLGWLLTGAWRNDAGDRVGVPVTEWRLGLGVRLRWGRLGLGADAEYVRAVVDRASTPGTLVGDGVAWRLVSSVDVVRLERAAVIATLDLGLAELGLGSGPVHEPSVSLSVGLRW